MPEFDKPIHCITLSLDGTCMLMHKDGWRVAMCGSIAFYDHQGDWSSRLKHKQGTASWLIKELEMQRANLDKQNFIERDEEIRKVMGYFDNYKRK